MLEGLDSLDDEARNLRGLVRPRLRRGARATPARPGPTRRGSGVRDRAAPQPLLGRLVGRAKRPHPVVTAPAHLEVRPAVMRDPHRFGKFVASEWLHAPDGRRLSAVTATAAALLAPVGPQAAQDPGEQHPARRRVAPPRKGLMGRARPRRGYRPLTASSTRRERRPGEGARPGASGQSSFGHSLAGDGVSGRQVRVGEGRTATQDPPRRRTARSTWPNGRALGTPSRLDPPGELGRPRVRRRGLQHAPGLARPSPARQRYSASHAFVPPCWSGSCGISSASSDALTREGPGLLVLAPCHALRGARDVHPRGRHRLGLLAGLERLVQPAKDRDTLHRLGAPRALVRLAEEVSAARRGGVGSRPRFGRAFERARRRRAATRQRRATPAPRLA